MSGGRDWMGTPPACAPGSGGAGPRGSWASGGAAPARAKASASSIIATARTPTDASILHAMQTARSLGLAVTLKPQIDVLPSGWVGTVTPSDPAAWFDSLQTTIYHYADLAQQGGAAMLVVGTE